MVVIQGPIVDPNKALRKKRRVINLNLTDNLLYYRIDYVHIFNSCTFHFYIRKNLSILFYITVELQNCNT